MYDSKSVMEGINQVELNRLITSARRGKVLFNFYREKGDAEVTGVGARVLSDMIVDLVNFKRMAKFQADLFLEKGEALSDGTYLKVANLSKESFDDVHSHYYSELLYELCDQKLGGDWSKADAMIVVCKNLVKEQWKRALGV